MSVEVETKAQAPAEASIPDVAVGAPGQDAILVGEPGGPPTNSAEERIKAIEADPRYMALSKELVNMTSQLIDVAKEARKRAAEIEDTLSFLVRLHAKSEDGEDRDPDRGFAFIRDVGGVVIGVLWDHENQDGDDPDDGK